MNDCIKFFHCSQCPYHNFWILKVPSDSASNEPNIGCTTLIVWTLIGKSWKTHPGIFLKFSFSGSSHRPFYWKTHPLKIMSTYSVFLKTGSWARPFCWKTHPIVNWRILGRHTGRFTGKLIQTKCYIHHVWFQSKKSNGWVFQ